MKKILFSIMLIMFFTLPLQAQENQKVLQRIFIEQMKSDISEHKAYFDSLPETLYSLITIRQPVVRVDVVEDAHSIITAAVEKKGADKAVIRFNIIREEKVIDSASLEFIVSPLPLVPLQNFLKNTAAQFARKLGPVPPLVRVTSLVQNEELRNTINNIEFSEKMVMPFEISLSAFVVQKLAAANGGMMAALTIPFPINLDFTWFLAPNHGLDFSLSFEHLFTEIRTHGSGQSPGDIYAIMGGVGYMFRTLGRFQASFGASFTAGVLLIIPEFDIIGATVTYFAGEIAPAFMSSLRLKIMVTYNFFENFGVFLRTGMQMNMLALVLSGIMQFDGDDFDIGTYYGRFEALGFGAVFRF